MKTEFRALVGAGCLLASTSFAHAQTLETIGNRASALGAFIAVADDASAAVWNPAGLINGPIFNMVLDFGRLTRKPDGELVAPSTSAARDSVTLIAVGVPPLGLTYSRGRLTEVTTRSAVGVDVDRQDRQLAVRSLDLSQIGVTVLHSLADGLTVGATVKVLHGSVAGNVIADERWHDAFDLPETLDRSGSTRLGVDAGILYGPQQFRVGLLARNLTKPRFGGTTSTDITLDRHVRAGVAWGDGWPGLANLIVAVDVDWTRQRRAIGHRRDVAAGVERWWADHRVGLRGGFRASVVGEWRPVATGGVSYAIRRGLYVDAYIARGRADDHGWGMAARLAY